MVANFLEARVVTGNAIRHPADESYQRLRIMPDALAGSTAAAGSRRTTDPGPLGQGRTLIELLLDRHILA